MIRDKNDKRMIRAVFSENKKYYLQIFLGECLYKLSVSDTVKQLRKFEKLD